jgi:hypothetical protein
MSGTMAEPQSPSNIGGSTFKVDLRGLEKTVSDNAKNVLIAVLLFCLAVAVVTFILRGS